MRMAEVLVRGVRHGLLALQFFTRIPVTGRLAAWVGFSPAMLRAAAAYFPAVGWLVGAVTAAACAGALWALPPLPAAPWVAAVLATAAGVMMTGAFHEDGLADTADALGGVVGRERALAIMKDSRIGSYAAVALVLALLAKVALLALLAQASTRWVVAALLLAHVTSRWTPLWLIRTLPYAGDAVHTKAKPLADKIEPAALVVATLWSAAAWLLCAAWLPLVACSAGVAAAVLALWAMRAWLARRLQGFTGDTLGAAQQLTELAVYLGVALGLGAAARGG